jgi:hypothetical protein
MCGEKSTLVRRNRIAVMKNRDLISTLAKLPLDAEVYVSLEPVHRRNSGPTLLASAILKVEPWEDAQAIVIHPVRRHPKKLAAKSSGPSGRYNPNPN